MTASIFTLSENNRKNDIIKTCLRIVDEHGLKGLTVARIAQEVGFSESALYRHFKSKAEIISMIIDATKKAAREHLSEVRKTSTNPEEDLRHLLHLNLEFLQQFPGLFRIIYWDEIHIGQSELMHKLEKLTSELLRVVVDILKDGKKEGIFGQEVDTKTAAIHFLGIIQTAFSFWTIEHRKGSLTLLGEKLLSQFLTGVKA
ncbi:MAG: TetR/AcrR family transcriptional regulator [Candidatus Aminicenantes bacterium]|jgi:AcrR family transcriptional regulator